MKRFFSEFGVLMKRRKHLLFLLILWSICSLTLFVCCKGLDGSIKDAFGKNENNEKKDYTYDLEVGNMDNVDKLTFRRALNRVLTENKEFGYYSYFVTSGAVVGIKNTENLDISTKTKTSGNAKDGFHTQYEVRVIFLDRNAVTNKVSDVKIATKLISLFEGDLDYDAILPVCFDYAWMSEGKEISAEEGYPISYVKTTDEEYSIDYRVKLSSFINDPSGSKVDSITLGSKSYPLEGAVIIPLREMGTSTSSANKQARREYWEHIYDMRNRGVIISDLKPDELQKYMDSLLDDERNAVSGTKLSEFFRIKIKDADYNNKLLYSEMIDDIKTLGARAALAAMIITGILLVAYLLASVSRNQRFQFLSFINGTGRLEFWLIYVLQIIMWFIFTVFPSYALYFGLMKILKTDFVELREYINPAAIIAAIGLFVVTVRLIIWNPGKILRRI